MTPIEQAASILRDGGTVVFPTETVYGLGANALNPDAVAKIFAIKRRPRFNPLIVHVSSLAMARELVAHIPPEAESLIHQFWPGPLTLVLPRKSTVPDLVTAGLPTVAVRMPHHPTAQALLQAAGVPLAAPSANRFTRLSPTRVEHARTQLGSDVDFYLDGGACDVGVESTIVGWIDGRPTCLRRGGIERALLETAIGELAEPPAKAPILAPGALDKHYSPRTPLIFTAQSVPFHKPRRVALLTLKPGDEDESRYAKTVYLSPSGDLVEAAKTLFAKLAELESEDWDLIVARPVPPVGLGEAINDRLTRAGNAETL